MIVNVLLVPLKQCVLIFLGLFRRALCCFSRRRHSNYDSSDEVLTSVAIQNHTGGNDNRRSKNNEREYDWNSWDDSPRTVEEHIQQYRTKLAEQKVQKEEVVEPNVDFFQDMEPTIKPQEKLLIGTDSKKQQAVENFRSLEPSLDNAPAELLDWADEAEGWEELDGEETKELIRDKRRQARQQRQIQRQMISDHSPFISK